MRRGRRRGIFSNVSLHAPEIFTFAQRRTPLSPSPALVHLLAEAYAEPPRGYHHLGHVDEVLGWYDWAGAQVAWRQPREVFVATLFHDAVYVPGARDNEARSAALAVEVLAGRAACGALEELRGIDAARVAELIALTARHGQLAADEVDDEAARFLDCDLAILAAEPARYRRYTQEIAGEYRALPAEAYRQGRRAFVTSLAARPRLFLSELFHRALDARARENLAAELAGAMDSSDP